MATRIGDYNPSITEPSRLELVSIARWLAENKKTAYLVGGWAVYYYARRGERPAGKYGQAVFGKSKYSDPFGLQPLGSKDIDIVFENKGEKEEFEEEYCRNNSYSKRGLFHPREMVKLANGVEIVFDPDVLSKKWKVRGTDVGWSHLATYNAQLEIAQGIPVLVPTKELLLLYKCVALVDRTDESKKLGTQTARLESKIWKDANDILSLHETGIDQSALDDVMQKMGLAQILNDAKQIISKNYDNYGFAQYVFSKNFLERNL